MCLGGLLFTVMLSSTVFVAFTFNFRAGAQILCKQLCEVTNDSCLGFFYHGVIETFGVRDRDLGIQNPPFLLLTSLVANLELAFWPN